MGIQTIQSRRDQALSMVDALFTKTQQSVLALLYGQAEKSFYTNEIIRKSGRGSGAVQRELSRLVRSGLATVTRIGAQNHYLANTDAPIYEELCSIVRKTVGLVEPMQHALQPLADHIELAFVFGSVARQQDSAFSDIDLLIVGDDLTYADVYPALEPLSQTLGRSIQPTIYSSSDLQNRIASDTVFVRRVLEQPKLWIIGQESELPAG
jgi:predicted nucleotidyltransferase